MYECYDIIFFSYCGLHPKNNFRKDTHFAIKLENSVIVEQLYCSTPLEDVTFQQLSATKFL